VTGRGEIGGRIDSVRRESGLGAAVTAELCEAYDAELAFVLVERPGPELIGALGLVGDDPAAIATEPVCERAMAGSVAVTERGTDLLGLGIHRLALAPGRTGAARLLVGVGRLSDTDFDQGELGLLEAIAESTARALGRFRPGPGMPASAAMPDADLDALAEFFRRLGHPVRLRILLALASATLSPSELEDRLAVGLGLVAYHVRTLRDDGLVALVETRATRGSLESFYRLTARGELARAVLARTARDLRQVAV
jgi:DNA-binding transcriptional ArsR family regulator